MTPRDLTVPDLPTGGHGQDPEADAVPGSPGPSCLACGCPAPDRPGGGHPSGPPPDPLPRQGQGAGPPGILRRLLGLARDILRAAGRQRHLLRSAWSERKRQRDYRPLVSVILPNYNHARFLPQRLDSILRQTYKRFEVVILDDASTDDSLAVIERYRHAHPELVRVIRNERNSGSVFRQWQKGVAAATGELLWVCESDDFAERDFLARLVPVFADDSVMIGFGRIQFADARGHPYPGLDRYRQRAQPGIWGWRNIRPARAWFASAFGVANVIPNVGGCLIRNQPIEPAVWDEAASFRVLGDWYLYAMLSRGGQIAYVPEAVAYFRQHGGNTSVSSFASARYYVEHEWLIRLLRQRWGVPAETVVCFREQLQAQFDYAQAARHLGSLDAVFDLDRVLATRRGARHVLLVILGFYLGGGELFPIALANALVQRGWLVSVMTLQSHGWEPQIRARLDGRIPVYPASLVRRLGRRRFIEAAGIDLIHSHFIDAEGLFLAAEADRPEVPYVVTLHGSYEACALRPDFVAGVAPHVTHWVYLTRRNLAHLHLLPPEARAGISASWIPNGMPLDPRPFGATRAELGIGEADLVFAIASRAIREKGWEEAIRALALAQARTACRLVLLLAGAGGEADRLAGQYGTQPGLRFLGFQDRVHGLYRLADCVLLPSRFPGESYPLALIQAMQAGRPVIATDLGEIAGMVTGEGRAAGLVIPPEPDDAAFVETLAAAMLAMTDPARRAAFARDAAALGRRFDMEAVADAYVACFGQAIESHRTGGVAAKARRPAAAIGKI